MKVTLTLLFLTSPFCCTNQKQLCNFVSLDTPQLLEGAILEKPAGMRTEWIGKEVGRWLRAWPIETNMRNIKNVSVWRNLLCREVRGAEQDC